MRVRALYLVLAGIALAEAPKIPIEDESAFWKAEAIFSSAQGAFQASLSDRQKQLLAQVEQSATLVKSAEDKLIKDCGGDLDQEERKKNKLACKSK